MALKAIYMPIFFRTFSCYQCSEKPVTIYPPGESPYVRVYAICLNSTLILSLCSSTVFLSIELGKTIHICFFGDIVEYS